MQNLSNEAIVRSFLAEPTGFYVSKYAKLQYNDCVLFSHEKPIAFFDKITSNFVCYYYPPKFSKAWTIRHLLEFQQQCSQAVKLPKLDATSTETHTFYLNELKRFADVPKTRAMLEHDYTVAKNYYAAVGVFVPPQATPMSDDYKKPTLKAARDEARQGGYEATIYKYTENPDGYFFSGRLYTKYDSHDLVYQATTMCRYYPQHKLFAIRAYDPRPNHASIINSLMLHTTPSLTNTNKHLLVPEAQVDLSDESRMLINYAQRLDDLANILLDYTRDTQTPRNVARRWAQIREHRENYIKLFHIPDINLPTFTPTAEQEAALKRYGAYRTTQAA